ncbi:hypothetical protein [Ideonella sp.]|uniref:hypothetical protein n=1 Tax=Ideonella sp. TaxID=1929293 RepID=UPI0037C0C496
MPQLDFNLIDVLKKRLLSDRVSAKKSELLRAGLHALNALPTEVLRNVLEALLPIKTGRPKKGH